MLKLNKKTTWQAIPALFLSVLLSSCSSSSPTTETLSLSSSSGSTVANLSQSTITITSNSVPASVGETVNIVASDPSLVTFTNGSSCTLVKGSCTVTIENSNAEVQTLTETLNATSSNNATGSIALQFTGVASDGTIVFDSLTGVSSTINVNQVYTATYTFINDSGEQLDDVTATVGASSSSSRQNQLMSNNGFATHIINNCNVATLTAGATCTITADLETATALSTNDFNVRFNFTKNGTAGVSAYSQAIYAIDNPVTDNTQMAVRIVNKSTTQTMYAVVVTNNYNNGGAQLSSLIPLTAGQTSGATTTYQGGSYTSYAPCTGGTNNNSCPYGANSIPILPNHQAVVLLPASSTYADSPINATQTGISGLIYLSLDQALTDAPAPSVTNSDDPNFNVLWGQFEYTLATADSAVQDFVPKYTVDYTNVDFVSLPLVFDALQDPVDQPIVNGTLTYNTYVKSGIKAQYAEQPMQDVLTDIADTLAASPNASTSWDVLVQRTGGAGSTILRVLSPNIGINTPYAMPTDYFTPSPGLYSADLWDYYKTHTLLVDDSGATGCTGVILSGQVTENSGVYTFAFTSQSTPACNTSIVAIANNTAGLPNNYDFFGGAGSSTYAITWGASNTSLAIVGESIVAAQSVGLMPYPDGAILSSANVQTYPYYANTQTDLLQAASGHTYTNTMYNVFSGAVSTYFNCYTYPYGDFLGASGTVSDSNVQLAPITLTLTG